MENIIDLEEWIRLIHEDEHKLRVKIIDYLIFPPHPRSDPQVEPAVELHRAIKNFKSEKEAGASLLLDFEVCAVVQSKLSELEKMEDFGKKEHEQIGIFTQAAWVFEVKIACPSVTKLFLSKNLHYFWRRSGSLKDLTMFFCEDCWLEDELQLLKATDVFYQLQQTYAKISTS